MNELLDPNTLRNPSANEVWKRREVDELLELYLGGADLGRIGATLGRNRKAIVRKIQEYIYNERDRVTNYVPRQRSSRKGKHITQNERQLIQECRKKGVPDNCIAAVLTRPVDDLVDSSAQVAKTKTQKVFAPTLDLILAHHYIYHVYKRPVLSNKAYDALVEEEREYGGAGATLSAPPRPCPGRIKTLALYLCQRHDDEQQG